MYRIPFYTKLANLNQKSPRQQQICANWIKLSDLTCNISWMMKHVWVSTMWYEQCIRIWALNTLRPGQNGRHFPDDNLKRIFLNENVWILIKISLKFVPRSPINNIPALVRIMAWRRPGDKPLSEPTRVNLPTHICVTRPQWVNITVWTRHNCLTPDIY